MERAQLTGAGAMAQEQRWVDAIGSDLSLVAASLRRAGEVFAAGFPGWGRRAADWFRFVSRRKTDDDHPVIPLGASTIAGLLIVAATILATVLWLDPLYLAYVRGNSIGAEKFFSYITEFGKSDWILISTGTIIVILSLVTGEGMRHRSRAMTLWLFLHAWYLFTAVAFSGLLANLAKNVIGRARPPFVTGSEVWVSAPFADRYAFAAFPSGHSTTAGALAMALALLFPRFQWFFWFAGAWIAISRPALGVHFPADVISGFAFGAAFSYFYARSFARKRLLFSFADRGKLSLRGHGVMRALLGERLRRIFAIPEPSRTA
jgi:undecaprenyl-diphosphatase